MKTIIFYFFLAVSLIMFKGYTNYKDKQSLNNELNALKEIIERQENELNRYQKMSEKAEAEKRQSENKSLERIEQLNNALKNNKCSDELVPAVIADKLYNRANHIRQSATSIHNSID